MSQTFISGHVGINTKGVRYFSYRIIDSDGTEKQRKKESSKWKNKKDAIAALEKFKESFNSQTITGTAKSEMTINQVFEILIKEKSNTLKPKSIRNYISTYKVHLQDEFGESKLQEITRQNIVDWQTKILDVNYRNEHDNKKNKNEKYKNGNLTKIQEQFKTILNFAVDCDYIQISPWPVKLRLAKNVLETKEEIKFWTYDEFKKFIVEIKDIKYRTFFEALYYGGFRLNECISINRQDISFKRNTIRIYRQYYRKEKTYGSPKSKNSIRTIHMNEILKVSLQKLIEENKKSIFYNDDSIVFGINKHLAPKTIENKYRKAIEQAGLKHITLHGFRHSHVSLLINMNVSAFEIAERIGDSVDMVYKVYGHMFNETKAETMKAMDAYLESKSKESKKS